MYGRILKKTNPEQNFKAQLFHSQEGANTNDRSLETFQRNLSNTTLFALDIFLAVWRYYISIQIQQ